MTMNTWKTSHRSTIGMILGLLLTLAACGKSGPTISMAPVSATVVQGGVVTLLGSVSDSKSGTLLKAQLQNQKSEFKDIGDTLLTGASGNFKFTFPAPNVGSHQVRIVISDQSDVPFASTPVSIKVLTPQIFYKSAGDKYVACVQPFNKFNDEMNDKYPQGTPWGKPAQVKALKYADLNREQGLCFKSFAWPPIVDKDVSNLANLVIQLADLHRQLGETASAMSQQQTTIENRYQEGVWENQATLLANRIRSNLGLPRRQDWPQYLEFTYFKKISSRDSNYI